MTLMEKVGTVVTTAIIAAFYASLLLGATVLFMWGK